MYIEPDYHAALTAAALFDLSELGKVLLTGPDAPQFVHNLCTNEVKDLPLGGGCAAYLCDPRAKVQFPLWIYHVRLGDGRHALWVETAAGESLALIAYLDRYLIADQVEMSDVSGRFAQFHLAGPQAAAILSRALADAVPELPQLAHMERTFGATATAHIRRHDRLGLPGYDIVILRERAAGVRELLLAAGAAVGRRATFETLRLEAGTPLFGVDIDRERAVMELPQLERVVSYSKGCFPGQEPIVMARDRTGHPVRTFVGMKVLSGGPPTPGTKLLSGGREVGMVTSSGYSPRLQSPVALGYVRWGLHTPGTQLTIEPAAGTRAVEVLGPPPWSLPEYAAAG